METKTEVQKQPLTTASLFNRDDVKKKFQEMLGKKAQGFITSVLQIANSSELLKKADPLSIYNAAAVAATLDLPINSNLGFAWIIPYNQKFQDGKTGEWKTKQVAQFQLGYKGFIQLAQRSGQFKTISATPIYEGQIAINNPLTGIVFDFDVKSEVVIGYAAFFQLTNGFYKTLYMSIEDLKKHGVKYSKTYANKNGLWNTDFNAMAEKTVIKLLLSKYAPLSIEMQKAVITDQAVINNEDGTDNTYVDHEVIEATPIDKEHERVVLMISDCKTTAELDKLQENNPHTDITLFESKREELKGGKNGK